MLIKEKRNELYRCDFSEVDMYESGSEVTSYTVAFGVSKVCMYLSFAALHVLLAIALYRFVSDAVFDSKSISEGLESATPYLIWTGIALGGAVVGGIGFSAANMARDSRELICLQRRAESKREKGRFEVMALREEREQYVVKK